ncbi:MAG: AraC family transcriptional regulator [Alphaproteobacteria bacterium HGW-Alphaproteobacteria-16]|nr:MAG: AraC family transcriptional regulator [Alphaproteobacteria bacterium HGW-Alphaproteobacteria-16]
MSSEVPHFSISAEEVGRDIALGAFGEAVHDVFAVELVDRTIADTIVEVSAWHLGTMMLGAFSGPPLFFDRPPALVARSGLDHMLVQLYVEGGFAGMAGSRPITVAAGDICVFDLTDTLSTRSTDFSNVSLLIPREAFHAALDDLSHLHGMVIPSASPLAGILAEYILSLVLRVPALDAREALLAAMATTTLTCTILAGQAPPASPQRSTVDRRSPLRQVCAYIDAHIQNPDLDAERIARALGLSRASLYRLFVNSGGVGRYIRRRRLSGAALDLSDPTRRTRVGEVALRWGFVNDASFARAFRQAFDIAPREARDRNFPMLASMDGETGARVSERGFAHWMRTLHTNRATSSG